MKYDKEKREISFEEKTLNELDNFMIDFINILENHADYVIVSGYVSILLGRSRATEDIDLLIPKMSLQSFSDLFNDLIKNDYECVNTSKIEGAFKMLDEHAIRFYREIPVPNIEFKQISNKIHKDAFNNKLTVKLKEKNLFISPLELQIAYKLSLMSKGSFEEISSDKDFEDAKHLYELFKEKLNKEELINYIMLFNVEDKWEFLKK